MKTVALVLLGLSCALIGNYISYRLSARVVMLEKLGIMFNAIVCEISYLSTPVGTVVSQLAERDDLRRLRFISECNGLIADGNDFRTAWKTAVSECSAGQPLSKSDINLLLSFGNQFGTTDSSGQLKICSMYIEKLKEEEKKAREQKERYAALSGGLGLLSGVGVIIVLF